MNCHVVLLGKFINLCVFKREKILYTRYNFTLHMLFILLSYSVVHSTVMYFQARVMIIYEIIIELVHTHFFCTGEG